MLIFILLFIFILLISVKIGGVEDIDENDWRWRKAMKPVYKNIDFEPNYSRTLGKIKEENFFPRHYREMISLKIGRRKIFFYELEFYMLFLKKLFGDNTLSVQNFLSEQQRVLVLHVGTKPGICSLALAKYFSAFTFHYYHISTPPGYNIKGYPNLLIDEGKFTDEIAEKYVEGSEYLNELFKEVKGKRIYVLFVPDYVHLDKDRKVDFKVDLKIQENWVDKIKPDGMSLKMKTPWRERKDIKYFAGDLYLEVRNGPSSAETRLVWFAQDLPKSFTPSSPITHLPSSNLPSSFLPKQKRNEKRNKEKNKTGEKKITKVVYKNDSYCAKLFYWQRHQRLAYHEIEIAFDEKRKINMFKKLSEGIISLCHCYDCWSEIQICHEFLKLVDPEYSEALKQMNQDLVASKLINLMNDFSKGSHSTLDISPHNLLIEEHDINKKIELAENITKKYVNDVISATVANENRQFKSN